MEAAIIGIGGFLVNYFMKISFRRIRPPDPLIEPLHDFSFPSGHALVAAAFAAAATMSVIRIWPRRRTYAMLIAAVWVLSGAISRLESAGNSRSFISVG